VGLQNAKKINRDEFICTEYMDLHYWKEFTVDILATEGCTPVYVVPRWRMAIDGKGEVIDTILVKNKDIIKQAKQIIKRFGIRYLACAQGFMHLGSGQVKWFEVNPRFGGGITASYLAGCNYPYLLEKVVKGEDPGYHEDWKEIRVVRSYQDHIIGGV
jgi:carbamoyl-phosphate synthase large subunit